MEKSREQIHAEALVERLFRDLDNRKGFDTGSLPDDVMEEWKAAWTAKVMETLRMLEAARP
jgi:hypothetical protein